MVLVCCQDYVGWTCCGLCHVRDGCTRVSDKVFIHLWTSDKWTDTNRLNFRICWKDTGKMSDKSFVELPKSENGHQVLNHSLSCDLLVVFGKDNNTVIILLIKMKVLIKRDLTACNSLVLWYSSQHFPAVIPICGSREHCQTSHRRVWDLSILVAQ